MKKSNLSYSLSNPTRWQHILCVLSICTAISGAAVADSNPDTWSGKLTLGFEHSTGTTNSSDVNASLVVERNKNFQASHPIRHTFNAIVDTEKTKQDNGKETKTRDKDAASYQLGYFLDEQSHIEGTISYLHDINLKIDEGKFASIEYIRDVFTKSAHKLAIGIGIAYLDIIYTNTQPEINGVGGQVSYNYTGQLTTGVSLNHKGLLKATADARFASLNTGISYALTENTSLSLMHHFSTLSDDTSNQDDEHNSTTHLTIGVSF